MRVLIVEDNPVRRKCLFNFFSRYGGCDMIIDGPETLDSFLLILKGNELYNLICIDIMMANVDGAMPINTRKMEEALKKLKLIVDESDISSRDKSKKADFDKEEKNIIKQNMQNYDLSSSIHKANKKENRYFRNAQALPEYQIEVTMETDSIIHFDFRSRLNTARFGMLRDEELFQSLQTDGNYLIFYKAGRMPI